MKAFLRFCVGLSDFVDTKLEERKANLQKANGTFTESTSEVHEEVPTVETVPEEEKEKKVKLTKQERKKLKKEEKKKAIEEKKASEEATSNGRVDQDADKEKVCFQTSLTFDSVWKVVHNLLRMMASGARILRYNKAVSFHSW